MSSEGKAAINLSRSEKNELIAIWAGIGVAVGAGIGTSQGDIVIGACIGVAVGAGVGAAVLEYRKAKR